MIEAAGELGDPKRVLLIKPSALGDVVTAVPVLRGLRRTFPKARISWLLSDICAPLVRHDSQLDEAILLNRRELGRFWRSPSAAKTLCSLPGRLRAEKFDWVIDLQGLLRSGLLTAATRAPLRAGFADAREGAWIFYTHRVETDRSHTVDRNIKLARHLGIDARSEDMTLQVTEAGGNYAKAFCECCSVDPGSFLICAPATTWPTKMYPIRHWRKVVAAISSRLPVVLIGTDAEDRFCRQITEGLDINAINLTAKTTVEQMVGLIAASAGVICSDSAAKFIAAATGVDCITLMGPTRVSRTGPYLRGQAIVADVPCQGCLRRRCGHITCMQLIDPADVIAAAEAMLNGRGT